MLLSKHRDIATRLAVESDYEDILELCENIHDGFDTLSVVFFKQLKDPSCIMLVAEKENKVIALISLCVIDGGSCVIVKNRRVHVNCRNKGYGTLMNEVAEQYISVHLPLVRVTKHATGFSRIIDKLQSNVIEFVSEKLCLTYWRIGSFLAVYSKNREELDKLGNNVTTLSPNNFTKMIEDRRFENVIRNNTLYIGLDPFQICLSNIPLGLLEGNDSLFVSTDGDDTLTSFSQGRMREDMKYMSYIVSIYTQDVTLFKSHILRQLLQASSYMDKKHVSTDEKVFTLGVVTYYFQPFSQSEVTDFLQDDLALACLKTFPEIFVIEKTLKKPSNG